MTNSDPNYNRGFTKLARTSPKAMKKIASKGGKEVHRLGLANKFTSEEAKLAGQIGGAKLKAERGIEYFKELGRKSWANRTKYYKPKSKLTSLPFKTVGKAQYSYDPSRKKWIKLNLPYTGVQLHMYLRDYSIVSTESEAVGE